MITAGATTTVTGSFIPKGHLNVVTNPSVPGAILVGPASSLQGSSVAPRDDNGINTDYPVGNYDVCFGKVTGLSHTPPCQNVSLTAGNTTAVTGAYS